MLHHRGGGVIVVRLDTQLREIAEVSRPQLQRRWAKLTGRPVPKLSVGMLRLALGYEIQAKAQGRLPRSSSQQLDMADNGRPRAMPLTPGMRLVREWHGAVHVVTIDETGAPVWNERTWKSLSEIARTITGTRWSGPAFFGLKQRSAA
jgi:hypothetical protein